GTICKPSLACQAGEWRRRHTCATLGPAGRHRAYPVLRTGGSITGMELFEDARMVTRAELAAWLRQVADQVDRGQVFYGAAGMVTVADRVHCELEVERDGSELSFEIEFSWPAAQPE